jgi:hypothetical protein
MEVTEGCSAKKDLHEALLAVNRGTDTNLKFRAPIWLSVEGYCSNWPDIAAFCISNPCAKASVIGHCRQLPWFRRNGKNKTVDPDNRLHQNLTGFSF